MILKKTSIFLLVSIMVSNLVLNAREGTGIQYSSQSDSLPGNMLIINSFDVMSSKIRKNKKALFIELTDSLKQTLYEATPAPNGKMIAIPDLVKEAPGSDSTIHSLMVQNNASKAIVIIELNAFFNQTHVDVVKEASGKDRTAYYDICSAITYRLYDMETKFKDSKISICEFFTTRNVVSGLFAAGPDIVGKKKHAFNIVRKNALEYLAKEMPWK